MVIRKGLVGLLGAGITALAMNGKVDAGMIYIDNLTSNSSIDQSELGLQNISGASDGYDINDLDFNDSVSTNALQIYTKTSIPGHTKLGLDSRSFDTSGWDFYLGAKGNASGDNTLGLFVTDSTDLGEFVYAYDTLNPGNKYQIPTDGTYITVDLPNLVNAGEYAHWRLDTSASTVPEPSTLKLFGAGLAGLGAYGAARNLGSGRRKEDYSPREMRKAA